MRLLRLVSNMTYLTGSFSAAPLLAGSLPNDPLGQLFVAIVLMAAVVFVGRFVLSFAWKLLTLGAVVVGSLYALSLVGAGVV